MREKREREELSERRRFQSKLKRDFNEFSEKVFRHIERPGKASEDIRRRAVQEKYAELKLEKEKEKSKTKTKSRKEKKQAAKVYSSSLRDLMKEAESSVPWSGYSYMDLSVHPVAVAIRICDDESPGHIALIYNIVKSCLKDRIFEPIDCYQNTALHYAVFFKKNKVVSLLIELSGEGYRDIVIARNKDGLRALDLAEVGTPIFRRLADMDEHVKKIDFWNPNLLLSLAVGVFMIYSAILLLLGFTHNVYENYWIFIGRPSLIYGIFHLFSLKGWKLDKSSRWWSLWLTVLLSIVCLIFYFDFVSTMIYLMSALWIRMLRPLFLVLPLRVCWQLTTQMFGQASWAVVGVIFLIAFTIWGFFDVVDAVWFYLFRPSVVFTSLVWAILQMHAAYNLNF